MYNLGTPANSIFEACYKGSRKALRKTTRKAFKHRNQIPIFVSPFHLLLDYSSQLNLVPSKKRAFLCHNRNIICGPANLELLNIPNKLSGLRVLQGDVKSPNLLFKTKQFELLIMN